MGDPYSKNQGEGSWGVKPEDDLCAPNSSAYLYTHPHTVRCIHKPTHINTKCILLSIDNKSISTSSIITSIDNQPFFSGLFSGGPYAGKCWVRSYKQQKIYKYSKQLGSRFIQNFLSARRDGMGGMRSRKTTLSLTLKESWRLTAENAQGSPLIPFYLWTRWSKECRCLPTFYYVSISRKTSNTVGYLANNTKLISHYTI